MICGMCGSLEHNGHNLTPMQEAIDAHRMLVEGLVAAVKLTRAEAIRAADAIKVIRGELEGNRVVALKIIDEGFNRLLRAIKQRRGELKALVNDAYAEKDDLLNKQITALEAIDMDSEAALQLVEATLALATPVELGERKQVLVDGLTRFTQHAVPLKESCSSTMSIQLEQSLEQSVDAILALGALDTSAADPTASTAGGGGLGVAVVGKASRFVVTAVEAETGKQRSIGGDAVEIKLAAPSRTSRGDSGGGGGGGAAANPKGGKRKRGGGGSGKGRPSKKTRASASASATDAAALVNADATVVDAGDGTYACSYILAEGTPAGEIELSVLVAGGHIQGSPFAVQVTAGKRFAHTRAFDTNGVLHWIGTSAGTKPYENPHGKPGGVVATMSTVLIGEPSRFVGLELAGDARNTTIAGLGSWMAVDLG